MARGHSGGSRASRLSTTISDRSVFEQRRVLLEHKEQWRSRKSRVREVDGISTGLLQIHPQCPVAVGISDYRSFETFTPIANLKIW